MTCDGNYLYIHNAHGLFKIGSGFGGTMKGHVYIHRPDFYPKQKGWLGFAHVSISHIFPPSLSQKLSVGNNHKKKIKKKIERLAEHSIKLLLSKIFFLT